MEKKLENYRGCSVGIALGRINCEPEYISDFFDNGELNAIEFPFESFKLCESQFSFALKQRIYQEIHCFYEIDEEFFKQVLLSEKHYRESFLALFESNLNLLDCFGIKTVTMNLNMNEIVNDEKLYANALILIRLIQPYLLKTDIQLLLPFRVYPSRFQKDEFYQMTKFLQDTLCPMVKLSLEYHFSDSQAEYVPMDFPYGFYWEAKEFILIYDADSGIRITDAILQRCIMSFRKYPFRGPFLIAPISQRNRMAQLEFSQLKSVISQLRNK